MNEWMINALGGCFINWIVWTISSFRLQAFPNKFNLLSGSKSLFLLNWQKESPFLTCSTDDNNKNRIARLFCVSFFPLWPLYTLILCQLSKYTNFQNSGEEFIQTRTFKNKTKKNFVLLLSRDLKQSWPPSPEELKNYSFTSFLLQSLKEFLCKEENK